VTTGGQLGVGGGGSNQTRSPRSDYVPPSEALQIEAPTEGEATPGVSAEEQTEAVNEESGGEEQA
jgi:hypothetical protein